MASDIGPFASPDDFVAFFNAFGQWMIASESAVAAEARALGGLLAARVARCDDLKRYNASAMNVFGAQTMLLARLKSAGVTGLPDSPPFPALFADTVTAVQTPTGGIAISADMACDTDGFATPAARLNVGPTPIPVGSVLAGISRVGLNGLGAVGIAAFQGLVETCAATAEAGFFCIVLGGFMAFVAAEGIDKLSDTVTVIARSFTGADLITVKNQSLQIEAERDSKRAEFTLKCFNDHNGGSLPLTQARAVMNQCRDNANAIFPDRELPGTGLGFLGSLALLTGVVVGGALLVQMSQRKSKGQDAEIEAARAKREAEAEKAAHA